MADRAAAPALLARTDNCHRLPITVSNFDPWANEILRSRSVMEEVELEIGLHN
ncbi:hypothetical protein A7A08_00500 [Methyloligella halotolerans]|uniref:Uncharacterized protein n=1 Tax=Methyloligella halotolerans TaxID=1177755 RepID=A0A1E2S2V5_9HYPH|nr:hypothetical protein A7A08_00500 [Methyloligella halotolerans]